MSHFAVLIIGDNPEEQLQPYHEYECTGIKDKYVVHVDKTEEVNDWLQENLFVGKTKGSDKIDYHYHEDKANEYLESWVKMKRIDYFLDQKINVDKEIKEWFGVKKKNGVWTKYTNPNAKWDWHQLGGRYTGRLKLKPGVTGKVGEPGIMTSPSKKGYADAALKRDIDFEGMRNESAEKAAKEYDSIMKVIGHLPVNQTWDELREKSGLSVDEARKAYWEQPRCKAWNTNKETATSFRDSPDDYLIDRETYIQNAIDSSCVMFALVKDSKWYERGEMGWWACVSNEKDEKDWNREFSKLLDEVPDDTFISIYDCHI